MAADGEQVERRHRPPGRGAPGSGYAGPVLRRRAAGPTGTGPTRTRAKYHQKLIMVAAEAAVIRQAAADTLDRSISLKAVARDLRARGEPTVTGTAWSGQEHCGMSSSRLPWGRGGRQQVAELASWWRPPGTPILSQPDNIRPAQGPADRPVAADQHRPGQQAQVAAVRVRHLRGLRRADQGGQAARTAHRPMWELSAATSAATPSESMDLISDLIIARLEEDNAKDLLAPPAQGPRP